MSFASWMPASLDDLTQSVTSAANNATGSVASLARAAEWFPDDAPPPSTPAAEAATPGSRSARGQRTERANRTARANRSERAPPDTEKRAPPTERAERASRAQQPTPSTAVPSRGTLAAESSSVESGAAAESQQRVVHLQEELTQAKLRALKKIKAQEAELDEMRLREKALASEKAMLMTELAKAQRSAANVTREPEAAVPQTPIAIGVGGGAPAETPQTLGGAPGTANGAATSRRAHLLHERVAAQARELRLERAARAQAERAAEVSTGECGRLRDELATAEEAAAAAAAAQRRAESAATALRASLEKARAQPTLPLAPSSSGAAAAGDVTRKLRELESARDEAIKAAADAASREAALAERARAIEQRADAEAEAAASAKALTSDTKERARAELERLERKLAESQRQLAKARGAAATQVKRTVQPAAATTPRGTTAGGLSSAELAEAEAELAAASDAGPQQPPPPQPPPTTFSGSLLASVDEQIAHDLRNAAGAHARLDREASARAALEQRLAELEAELEQVRKENVRLVEGSGGGGDRGNLEFLRNVLLRFIEMPEEENGPLLQVIATFMQFSAEEVARLARARHARAQGTAGLGLSAFLTPLRSRRPPPPTSVR